MTNRNNGNTLLLHVIECQTLGSIYAIPFIFIMYVLNNIIHNNLVTFCARDLSGVSK